LKMAGGKENIEKLIRGIIALQALYRGHRTRQAMKKVREEFSSVFADIEGEGSSRFEVQWHSHFVVGRPFIKPSEQSGNLTAGGEFCNPNVEENGRDFSDSSSKPISSEKDVEMDLFDEEECEYQTILGDSFCSTKLSPSALNNGREQTGKSEKDLQPPSLNRKVELGENLTADRESLSNSMMQSRQIGQQDSIEEALGHEKDKELSKEDQNVLNLIKLGDIKSMTKEVLSQKEKEIQMELIWIQQAIESRKQYIKLKG